MTDQTGIKNVVCPRCARTYFKSEYYSDDVCPVCVVETTRTENARMHEKLGRIREAMQKLCDLARLSTSPNLAVLVPMAQKVIEVIEEGEPRVVLPGSSDGK